MADVDRLGPSQLFFLLELHEVAEQVVLPGSPAVVQRTLEQLLDRSPRSGNGLVPDLRTIGGWADDAVFQVKELAQPRYREAEELEKRTAGERGGELGAEVALTFGDERCRLLHGQSRSTPAPTRPSVGG